MEIKTNARRVNITLRLWDAEAASYSPDFFCDAETAFAANHQCECGSSAYLATDNELADMIGWWEGEVAAANRGAGEALTLDDEQLRRGDEYSLDVTELPLD